MFKVGEKIVCIVPDDVPRPMGGPRYGDVDTITRIRARHGRFWLILQRFGPAVGYQPECFRKLHDETVQRILDQVTKKPIYIR